MSDRMTPIPYAALMDWILNELPGGSVFGVKKAFAPQQGKTLDLFGEKLETPFGPAAGPHTQLAQNLIAAYYAGSRFFELKTVQIMDGDELAACIGKPCIVAEDECYNCEWSTELTVGEAMDEYIKGWFALKLLAREFGWGDPDGFVFNMSVGYDFAGITTPKIDGFIEGLKDAQNTPVWAECLAWAKENLHRFSKVDEGYLATISPHVCRSICLSTLHGCPPQEIERIASYLISAKKLHTFVKCNPTILGYAFVRETLDNLGFDYVAFDEHHFNADLQYKDAVPMFERLLALAGGNGLTFGLKLSNTFPAQVKANELPSEEMYMSGRALYPLTIEMAARFATAFDGKLRLSFSGGIDAFNIIPLFEAGVWPITLATTLLKPGGYGRLTQMADALRAADYAPFAGVNAAAVAKLAEQSRVSERGRKAIKPLPNRKLDEKVPLVNCFTAPCRGGCPIKQDIPEYLELVGQGKYREALTLICEKNPLPFITGTICSHRCMDKCTRNFYEESIHIRSAKLVAAEKGYEDFISSLQAPLPEGGGQRSWQGGADSEANVAIIGGGPAGMAAAFLLARKGAKATIFEQRDSLGGIVKHVIPTFRIGDDAIAKDAALLDKLGVNVKLNTPAPSADELFAQGYSHIIYAVGAWAPGKLWLENGQAMNVLRFLEEGKAGTLGDIGTDVVIVGGGNSAMDAARAAVRAPGVQNVRLVYRRTARYMPADEEELQLALKDGVQFMELLAPVSWQGVRGTVRSDTVVSGEPSPLTPTADGGSLTCKKMVLGEPDASGRRSPVETDEIVTVPCTALIAAVGEKVDAAFFEANGIACNAKGWVQADDKLQTNRPNVFVIGDAWRGPATVVEGIADAQTVADAIGRQGGCQGEGCQGDGSPDTAVSERTVPADTCNPAACYAKQGVLKDYVTAESENARCLACATVCECCAQVCPNRANVAIAPLSEGGSRHSRQGGVQIIHIDKMCNECGNCLVFCPYNSSPYKEKWTLFSTKEEFSGSENPGFFPLGGKDFLIRLGGTKQITLGDGQIPAELEQVIETVLADYPYLLNI